VHVGVGVFTHTNREYKDADGRGTESFGQENKYINMHVDVYFEIRNGDYEYGKPHKTRSVRNTDRQPGKEESIHTRNKLIESGKQIRNVREGD